MTELQLLTTDLERLRDRVLPHWQEYIDVRLEADAADAPALAWCAKWVRRHATIDGVPGPGVSSDDPEWAKTNRPRSLPPADAAPPRRPAKAAKRKGSSLGEKDWWSNDATPDEEPT